MATSKLISPMLLVLLALSSPAAGEARSPDAPPRDCEGPVCFLDSGLDPAVSLAWADLEPRSEPPWLRFLPEPWRSWIARWLELRVRRVVTLEVANRREHGLKALVTLQPWGLRREVHLPEYSLRLGPRGKQRLRIPVSALGYDLSRPQALVGLQVAVESFARSERRGRLERLGQTLSPMLYLLSRDPQVATLEPLEESQLDELVNLPNQSGALNPACTLTIPPPGSPDADDLELAIDPGTGDPVPGQDFAVDPPAGGGVKFCFALPVTTLDAGIGEDFGVLPVTNYPASHAQVTIGSLPPGAATVVDGEFLDADGCIEFPHVSDPGYSVRLTGRAQVPSSNDPSQSNGIEIQTETLGTPAWHWCSDEGVQEGDLRWFYASPNRRTNLLALATFSLIRFSDGVGGQTIFVQDRPCTTNPTNSCNTNSGVVQINPDHNQYRYAVAHEMGHAVVHRFLGNSHPLLCGAYGVNAGGVECAYDLSHGLHSKEFSASAITEGFAQFYATAVFNRLDQQSAWFHYYKEDYKGGAVTVVDMEGQVEGGSTAYLDTICEGPEAGFGVELDWARAFWDYLTNPGTRPTRLQLLEQLELAYDSEAITPAWDLGNAPERMAQATEVHVGGTYAERWLEMAEFNGVDPTFSDSCDWFCFPACDPACTEASCNCSDCNP